jgi:methylmalonyl-CoA/ethylmalonyl-CoA epimerase
MSQRPFKILAIEHVGVAVENMEGISAIFSDILGLEFTGTEEVKDQNVITDIYQVDNSKLEFLQSTSPDSPIARFIEQRGEGMHHIALLVDHLQPALDYLQDQGIQLIDKTSRIGAEGLSIAFLHPKSTGGILIELCEKK